MRCSFAGSTMRLRPGALLSSERIRVERRANGEASSVMAGTWRQPVLALYEWRCTRLDGRGWASKMAASAWRMYEDWVVPGIRSRHLSCWICSGRCPEDLLWVLRRAHGVTTDEAAPGADVGKRGLGLPLPIGAGTGPVAEASCPGAARLGLSLLGCLQPLHRNACIGVEWMRACRKLPAVPTVVLGPKALLPLR